jgi:hypothetical protein
MVMQGFATYADSTVGWVSEADWTDFRMNQPFQVDLQSGLKLHTRGVTAQDIQLQDVGETYAVKRYTGKFVVDEMDIIDDRFGANQMMPAMLGRAAAELRPDLVYALLMANANLSDSTALFAAGRNNVVTGTTLSVAGLTSAENRLALQTILDNTGRPKSLNLRAGWLIVPRTLRQQAKRITGSANNNNGSTTDTPEMNPHQGEYQYRSDARLDNGVINPLTNNLVAGSASTHYVIEETGQHGVQVGYRQGTGRAPSIRSHVLNNPGQWGLAWDVLYDLGVGVVSPRGMVRITA